MKPRKPDSDQTPDPRLTRSNGDGSEADADRRQAIDPRQATADAPAAGERYRRPAPNFTPASSGYREDYRYGVDYRGMDYRGNDPVATGADGQIDWASALWRYRFAMLLPALLGLGIGGAVYTTRPNIYRSTARMVVESEKPWAPAGDMNDDERINAVPPSELLLMQLQSEYVLDYAARHPLLTDVASQLSINDVRMLLVENVEFEDAMGSQTSDRALAFFLHFDNEDPRLAVSAVTALSDGLQNFFAKENESSIAELKQLITTAKDKLLPELNALETEYRRFRESSDLSWDKAGQMMNPYQEKRLALQTRRLSLEDELRDLSTKLTAISTTVEATQDPLLAMEVIQQLLGEDMFAVRQLLEAEGRNLENDVIRDEDLSLARLTVERTLLPLEIERKKFATQFGVGHPSVRVVDQQISATRKKLHDLTEQETKRRVELRLAGDEVNPEVAQLRQERAQVAVNGFIRALQTRKSVYESQISVMDGQIQKLADQATRLTRAENENVEYLRKIERAQKMFDSVEEQMTRVNLSDQDAAMHVTQLNPPSEPKLVSPILVKFLAIGTMLGGFGGLALVYLLESQSKTYRSSEEITANIGLRVLSHVPTDTHRLPKVPKGETYRYQGIDPGLSSIHRPRSLTAEAIRRLRTAVFFDSSQIGAQVIQVTSPLPEDGKSTLAANLAVSIAQSGKTVVLVDADMRRPQLTASFGMEDRLGLSDLIDGDADLPDVLHKTVITNLSIVPCGPVPANPAESLSMKPFGDLLLWLKDQFDYVIVDTPPLLVVTDPSIVASVTDAVLFTFRVRRGCKPQTKEAVAMLRSTGTPVFGCIVNRADHNTSATGYRSYQGATHYQRQNNRNSLASESIGANGKPIGAFEIALGKSETNTADANAVETPSA